MLGLLPKSKGPAPPHWRTLPLTDKRRAMIWEERELHWRHRSRTPPKLIEKPSIFEIVDQEVEQILSQKDEEEEKQEDESSVFELVELEVNALESYSARLSNTDSCERN